MQHLLRGREALTARWPATNDIAQTVGRLALWAAAFVTAYQGQMLLEDGRNLGRALVYMAVATVFIAAATWRLHLSDDAPRGESAGPDSLRQRLWPVAVPLLLLLVAVGLGIAFRLYRLPTDPFGIWFDEANNGIIADRMLHDPDYKPVFITEYVGTDRPALPVYVFAAGVKLIGREILALRSVSALAGILTLIPLFFLGRELFGWRVAALATFFLAVMRWHLNFSRLAMEPIWAPFFAVAAILFLVRGVRRGRWYDFVASGLLLGLGLQFYWAFLLVPLLYGVYTAHSFLARQSARLLALGMGAILVLLVGFAAYSPVAVYGIQHPDEYTRRANTVTITKDKDLDETVQAVLRTSRLHVLMFNSAGDGNGRHNLPGEPMLDTFTGIFFVLGLGMSLSRLWEPRNLLLLAWVALLLQPAIWSLEFEAPQALRSILVTPAVALLAALPVGALWSMVAGRRRGTPPERVDSEAEGASSEKGSGEGWHAWRPWLARLRGQSPRYLLMGAAGAAILFFLAQTAYRNYNTYFNVQLQDSVVWQSYSTDVTVAADEMKRLGPDYDYWLATLLLGQPTLEFVSGEISRTRTQPFLWARDLPAHSSGSAVYLLDGSKEPFYEWLKVLYPEGSFRTFAPPNQAAPVVVYEAVISSDEVRGLQGLDGVYVSESGQRVSQREATLDLDWSAGAPVPLPLDAVWSGFLEVSNYRHSQLVVEAPGEVRLFLDGALVAEGQGRAEVGTILYQGEHEIRVEAHVDSPGRVRLSWDGSTVPAESLFAYPMGGRGLLGSFYANADWEGEPARVELTPLLGLRYHAELSIPSPFTAIWQGYLEAPVSGEYRFMLETIDDGWLAIDGQEVLRTPGTPEVSLTLTAGRHPIEVGFRNRGGFARIFLYWTPPGGEREVIPPANLSPR